MKPVDYDCVAPAYDRRYETNRFEGIEQCLRTFLRGTHGRIAEVGCGTGHWLACALRDDSSRIIVGLDRSLPMLVAARATAPAALLVRGTADRLPWADASFERVFCIHALHHFEKRADFFAECARVTQPNGSFLNIALDPHTGRDRWWIYDYFPAAIDADRERYPSSEAIRESLRLAGFHAAETTVAQHVPAEVPFESAEELGVLDRRSTSQLMVIGDDDWEQGIARVRAERPVLRADLWLYATIGRAKAS